MPGLQDAVYLIDHFAYELEVGQLSASGAKVLVPSHNQERVRFLHPSSHVVNTVPEGKGKVSFKLWLVRVPNRKDRSLDEVISQSNFFLGGEPFQYEYKLGERIIPPGYELWGQASEGAALNYFLMIKEQQL